MTGPIAPDMPSKGRWRENAPLYAIAGMLIIAFAALALFGKRGRLKADCSQCVEEAVAKPQPACKDGLCVAHYNRLHPGAPSGGHDRR